MFLRCRYLCMLLPICISAIALDSVNAANDVARVSREMQVAAQAWLKASGDLGKKASFPLHGVERTNWNFVPMARQGASLGEMNPAQRKLTHALLQTALSTRGYLQATTIVSLELVLREIEGSQMRDAEKYYLTLFGKPEPSATWGWRFEGHHLSLNFSILNGQQVTVTPSFFGSNPAEFTTKGKLMRPLAEEEKFARALITSLNEDQRKSAIFATKAPREILSGTTRHAERLEPPGIAYTDLTEAQRAQLQKLVSTYANRYRSELAKEDLIRIEKSGWSKVFFAWAGGLEKGQGHYYRVQGPTFLLEYDNTQNRANHIHTVWRDLERDFGGDPLAEHYRTAGHDHGHHH